LKILTSLIAVALLITAGATFAELRQGAYVIGASGGTITGGGISAMVVLGEPISGTVEAGEMEMQAGFIPVWLYGGGILSAPEEPFRMQPETFTLSNPYPNPFNSTTRIVYNVPQSSHISLMLYDITGRVIATLVNDNLQAGVYTASLNADDLPSGLYFVRLEAGGQLITRKIMLIR